MLRAEHWNKVMLDHDFAFTRRVAIISNVADRADAEATAQRLLRDGGADAYYFVDDHLAAALEGANVTLSSLGRIHYYSTWAYVAAHVCTSRYLLHWDADAYLAQPYDWVTPCLARLETDPRAFSASPLWAPDRMTTEQIRSQSDAEDDDFFTSYGFSDQVYLARAHELRQPIYGHRHIYSRRYPLAHIAPIFEQRVDSFMRRQDRTRLAYKHAAYVHPFESEGATYPTLTPAERCRKVLNRHGCKLYRSLSKRFSAKRLSAERFAAERFAAKSYAAK